MPPPPIAWDSQGSLPGRLPCFTPMAMVRQWLLGQSDADTVILSRFAEQSKPALLALGAMTEPQACPGRV